MGVSDMEQSVHPVLVNTARLNEYMDRNGLSALAIRSGINFTYLTGMAMPGTLARHLDLAATVRGFMVIWPRNGEAVVVVDAFAERLGATLSSLKRFEVYEAYRESLYDRVPDLLAELGLSKGRVGFESDSLSAAHWHQIQAKLPDLKMVDCSAMMDEVRWIKTSSEVELQKEAADLLDEAYLEVFPTIRPGDTEREVHARILGSCIRRGFGWAHGILNSSANHVMYGGEGDLSFRPGDFVRNDYVAYLRGYAGHQSRLAILGSPTADQQSGYELTLDIHRKTIDKCRPGITAGDVYAFVVEEFRKNSIEYTASLVGHSMGPWFHQQEPILRRGSTIVLEPGMLLAIEPQRQHWHLQDLILVQEDQPLLLSDRFSTDDMFVI
jgi:Xaa-Pro aminopeptidase